MFEECLACIILHGLKLGQGFFGVATLSGIYYESG
jgi:hypothetical protein